MKARMLALAALLLAFGVAMLTSLYPVPLDFWPQNPFWNGLSRAAGGHGSLAELSLSASPSRDAIAVIGPSKPFAEKEAEALKAFLARGGELLVADDYGSANTLLELLGVPVRVDGRVLRDPLFNEGSPEMPRVRAGNLTVALNYASSLVIGGPAEILANSSAFSYLDTNGNGVYDEGEPVGPFPVAARVNAYGGTVIVISDSSVFINSMLDRNRRFLHELVGDKRLLIDTSHLETDALTDAKNSLYKLWRALETPANRYLFSAAIAVLAAGFAAGRESVREDEVDKTIKEHPGWNRELLERIWRELRGEHERSGKA